MSSSQSAAPSPARESVMAAQTSHDGRQLLSLVARAKEKLPTFLEDVLLPAELAEGLQSVLQRAAAMGEGVFSALSGLERWGLDCDLQDMVRLMDAPTGDMQELERVLAATLQDMEEVFPEPTSPAEEAEGSPATSSS